MRLIWLCALALTFPVNARTETGCPEGRVAFHCTFAHGRNAIEICDHGGMVSYVYGRIGGLPDLALNRPHEEVLFTPWNGVGPNFWEEVTFSNKGVAYKVGVSQERREGAELEGSIAVYDGEQRLALLICDTGSVSADFRSFDEE